jgi:hypothetical protein
MTKHPALRQLDRNADRAYRAMLNGKMDCEPCRENSWTTQDPVLYQALEAAYAECRTYREAHNLIGMRGY